MANSPKIQRWIDLLATLLSRKYPATLEELVRDVPATTPTRASPPSLRQSE